MKVEIILLLIYLVSTKKADPIKAPLHLISYDDISPAEREHLAFLEEMSKQREKRSGHSLLSILGNGLKSKLGSLAKASASSSAHFISSSSGHYDQPHDYDHHHEEPDYHHDQKSFDFWSLNKSILNTLLQAVKAIKGATIALTGKLIKGSGYLVSAKGKLISHGGDAVTTLGKNIATSALLSPVAHGSHSSSYSDHSHEDYHSEYGPPSNHDAEVSPSAIAAEYSSGPDLPNKYLPSKYSSYEDKKSVLNQLPEGIIILKKMPTGHHLEAEESQRIPDFKPLDPQTPNYREVLGSLLASASNANSNSNLKQNEYEDYSDKNVNINNIAQLPLEHKSPSVNYLKYLKDSNIKKPSSLSLNPIQVYDPQVEFSNYDSPSFSNGGFISEFNTIPMDLSPQFSNQVSNQFSNQVSNQFSNQISNQISNQFPNQFSNQFSNQISNQFSNQLSNQFPNQFSNLPNKFSHKPTNLKMIQHLQDPRTFSKSKPFLPTPLTNTEFMDPGRLKKMLKGNRQNVDVVKSITYELRPNGPVKI